MPNQDNQYFFKEDRWNGGLSEDSRLGLPGSMRFGIGCDIRSDSGFLSVAKKPVRHDAGIITDEIDWFEEDPDTHAVYCYGKGKIWIEQEGIYSLAHEMIDNEPNGQGLKVFDKSLYYRTVDKLGRYDFAIGNWDDEFVSGLAPSTKWGPMCNVKNVMLFGHGRFIGTVDDVQFVNPEALTLPPDYFVRHIFRAGSYAVILATRGESIDASEEGMMFLWDTTSDTYNDFIPLDGNPHAGISHNNKITIFCGQQTTIQESLGGSTQIIQGIPGIGDGEIAEIYPGAVDVWRNMVHFGISDGNAGNVVRCLYNYGAKNSKFFDVLNSEFPTSVFDESGDFDDLFGSRVRITAVKKIGTTLRFAWNVGDEYGVDQIDTTQYQNQAIRRSLAFDRMSPYEKTGIKLVSELKGKLAEGESVKISVSPDPYGDPRFENEDDIVTYTESTVDEKTIEIPMTVSDVPLKSRDLHVETVLSGTGTTRPSIKRTWIQLDENADQM